MTYKRFEELPVWNSAIDLAVRVFDLTDSVLLRRFSDIRDHIERAAVSISNNIAEGFERGTTAELLAFLYIARGSTGEVRSLICLMERIHSLEELYSELNSLKFLATSISRQLGAWAESLKNSKITGTRYLDDQTRNAIAKSRRRDAFLEEIRRVQENQGRTPPDDAESTNRDNLGEG